MLTWYIGVLLLTAPGEGQNTSTSACTECLPSTNHASWLYNKPSKAFQCDLAVTGIYGSSIFQKLMKGGEE